MNKINFTRINLFAAIKKLYFCKILLLVCINCFAKDNNVPLNEISHNSLKGFVFCVLDANPSIQAAKANIEANKARLEAAKQPLYNPELIAETEQKNQKSFKDPEIYSSGLKPYEKTYTMGINQTVDLVNKRNARSKVADASQHIAEAQLIMLRQQLATEILNALSRYNIAQKVLTLSKERTALLKQFVELTEKREATGDVARVETDLAQLALSEALAQQATAEISLNQALQSLLSITGTRQIHWPNLPSQMPNPTLTNLPMESLLNSLPSIQVQNEQIVNARMRVGLAKKERFADPTFGLQGGQEYTDEGRKRVVLATFSIPLYIRNSFRAEVEAASFDAIEAEKKLIDSLRQARADIESSAERYKMLFQTVSEWQKIAGKPLSDGLVLIERLWRAGEMTTVDYLVQLKQRLDSQIAGVELQGQAWQAWVDWLKASGKIENWLSEN